MTLVEEYIFARWTYAIGEEVYTDQEYKLLENKVKEQDPENEYLKRSWSNDPCPIDILKKYGKMEYYRNIKFSYQSESIPSINDEGTYKATFFNLNKRSRLSTKQDGWNTQVNYYNNGVISAETRGRTGNFMNANCVTQIVPKVISSKCNAKIIGETVISSDQWLFYKIQTGNKSQRASVSTALANGDTQVLKFVAYDIKFEKPELYEGVDHYEILKEWGFNTPEFLWVENFNQLEVATNRLTKMKKFLKTPTDGMVLENDSLQVALRIKGWAEPIKHSFIMGLEENYGCYGNAIKARIFPVVVEDGSSKSQVNVVNLNCVLVNNLCMGSPIAFDIRSATNCVINQIATRDLQDEWSGRYNEYCEKIKEDARLREVSV